MPTKTLLAPDGFKLSKRIRDELPPAERDSARASLWAKSQGRCSLCAEPLPADGSLVDVDHMIARKEGSGGSSDLKNLYLTHRSCNRSRGNLPFELAKIVIPFAKWCTARPRRSFEEVVTRYIKGGNKRVDVDFSDDRVTLTFGTEARTAPLYEDPATRTKYFFMNTPVEFIQNDAGTQPRFIEHDHVRNLAIEFNERPVHEPSNCRLVSSSNGIADLKQFDGQHKTTAQVILGRREVPMKFYVDPDLAMIQKLVVQIQQGIQKRPLSTTDTLRKLDDVVRDKVDDYRKSHGGVSPTEAQLVGAQPLQNQAAFKKHLLTNFEYAILADENLEIKDFVSKKKHRGFPLTDRVLVSKIIHPLVCQELLDVPIDDSLARETEREVVVQIINRLTENMLTGKWAPKAQNAAEDIATRRARAFFMQGAVGWWLGSVFIPALQGHFMRAQWARLFLEPLTDVQRERVDGYLDIVCGWDIWSTQDESQLAALRSNTPANTQKAFPQYSNVSLVTEFGNQ